MTGQKTLASWLIIAVVPVVHDMQHGPSFRGPCTIAVAAAAALVHKDSISTSVQKRPGDFAEDVHQLGIGKRPLSSLAVDSARYRILLQRIFSGLVARDVLKYSVNMRFARKSPVQDYRHEK